MRDAPVEHPSFTPPAGGLTAGDLDRIPGLPRHTELIDGALVFRTPQNAFHTVTVSLLVFGIRDHVPPGLRVRREMTVTLAKRQRPEPDVLVVREEAVTGLDQTDHAAADVLLAAEVVSPDSAVRDRERKPRLCAEAGIPHLWRVENVADRPAVHVYELDPATRVYSLTGIHHDRLELTVPFDIDIDLTEIDEL
ncbi:Uma2 family endonuclease [Actinomadura sp. DC4]|uniref:Uma2 family endonuclease n=1 Tax=Actinomadura sp. DC4 TaxID=3055069 RepID=UPI0025B21D0C|nr:Uma2 family endonuclease [Actinomadura sp. DC4]MDN3352462.1 Uma2 family endonuclease [Actinomadura sp. DC4]